MLRLGLVRCHGRIIIMEAAARADDDGIPVELLKHAGDEIVNMSMGIIL